MRDLGNRTEDSTIDFAFHTTAADGTPTTLSGTPAISVYKANGTTQSGAGVTLTADFDSVTGLNHVRIDTSADAFYAVASDYIVVITTGTVDGTSVVGAVVATFSIENRFDEVDVTKIGGVAQSATDLKHFADSGYDPATGKVQGVVLVDTTTTNTDMRGTNSAALASVCTETRLAELDAANLPADVDTLLSRITSTLFSGITSLAQWLGLLAGKQTPNATALTEIKATGAGSGTYDATAHSNEALRDRGDSAWITATGFSTFDASTDKVLLADGAHGGSAATITLQSVALNQNSSSPAITVSNAGTGPGLFWFTNSGSCVKYTSMSGLALEATSASSLAGLTTDITGNLSGSVGSVVEWEDGGRLDLILDIIAADVVNLDGDAMRGTDNASTHSAADVEAAILDEGDATALLAAIAAKVEEFLINEGDATATLVAIAAAIRTELATELGRIDAAISTRSSHTAAAVNTAVEAGAVGTAAAAIQAKTDQLNFTGTDVKATLDGETVTATTVSDKTGYSLAATGLDAIAATTPIGVATTFATKMMQLWARFFGRTTKDSDEMKTYRSDGTTVATTQTYTSSGDDEDVSAAS
jgi:hypothetical protein